MNEARVQASLQIQNGNLNYQSKPNAFVADVAGINGPTPGSVLIAVAGTDINLSALTTLGGLCRLMNLDSAATIMVGVYDTVVNDFFPLIDLLPGETFVIRLSHDLGKHEVGTGTGTLSGTTAHLHAKALGAPARLLVEAFDP